MKFLTPQSLVPAIIGRGGLVIGEIENNTNARLSFSKGSNVFPSTGSRVLTASADDPEALDEVVSCVVEKLAVIAARTSLDLGSDDSDLKIGVLMPKTLVDNLAQRPKGAEDLKQLCDDNDVMLRMQDPIPDSSPDASQELQLIGAMQSLVVVLQ